MEQLNNGNIEVQVGNIITNVLLQNQALFLPQIGSLSVDVAPSLLRNKEKITPPKYIVKFQEEQCGVSIIEVIMSVCDVETQTAEEIYDQWYTLSKREQGVEIIGVGTLEGGKFITTPELLSLLNPEANKSVKLKKRSSSWLWILVSVIVCVVVGIIANSSFDIFFSKPTPPAPEPVIEVIEEPVIEPVVEVIEEPTHPENPLYRVVYGVFAVESNASNAVELTQRECDDVVAKVYQYGEMFMVSIFGSDDFNECLAFAESHKDKYADLWVYIRREE